jgi:hypothetical protein
MKVWLCALLFDVAAIPEKEQSVGQHSISLELGGA